MDQQITSAKQEMVEKIAQLIEKGRKLELQIEAVLAEGGEKQDEVQ